jgi:hypothetical protein
MANTNPYIQARAAIIAVLPENGEIDHKSLVDALRETNPEYVSMVLATVAAGDVIGVPTVRPDGTTTVMYSRKVSE